MDKDREKRLKTTGRWFEKETKFKLDIWSAVILPLILIISLIATVYLALT